MSIRLGLASAMAALHAFLADTTTRANRYTKFSVNGQLINHLDYSSRVFSLSLGLIFSGMGIGPTLGGLLIRVTGDILSVFYFATLTHFIYAFLIWFIIPESLTQAQRRMSRVKHSHSNTVSRDGQNKWTIWMKRIFGFLSPLSVFMPEVTTGTNPLKTPRRDWNLTLVAFAYGFTLTLIVSCGSRINPQFISMTMPRRVHIHTSFNMPPLSLVGPPRRLVGQSDRPFRY